MAAQDQFNDERIRSEVRKHYGEMASRQRGSSTSCCSSSADSTPLIYAIPEVGELPLEVRSLSAGCGDPVTLAELESGQTVLDLGSGGGIDCFLAANKVGPDGYVIGVDMTPEMLTKARVNKNRTGLANVDFRLGEIEHLPVADESVDVIISNCVINLSPDKPQVFREAFRVLKPGGRLAVSDIVTDGPIPEELLGDVNSWACCIAGAIDQQEYIDELGRAGFVDIEVSPQTLNRESMADLLGQDGIELIKRSEHHLRIKLNGEWVQFELGDLNLPFSARITARKPQRE